MPKIQFAPNPLLLSTLRFMPPYTSMVIILSIMSASRLSSLPLDQGMSASTLAMIVMLKCCMIFSMSVSRLIPSSSA